jgi:signal transduction histidine kinase
VLHGESTELAPVYVGVDRRSGRSPMRTTIRAGEAASFVTALVLVGIVFPMLLTNLPSLDDAEHAQAALRTTWSMLFVGAGLFRLVRWRLTGETTTALLGAGMLCFGLLCGPTAALAPLIHTSARDIALSPATRAVAVSVFLVAIVRSFRAPAVDAHVHPVATIGRWLLVAGIVLTACIAEANLGTAIALPAATWLVVGLVQAAGWCTLAVVALRRGIRLDSASYVWIGFGLLLLTAAETLHALAFVGPLSLAFFGTCLQVVAAGVALANSAADLGLVFSADGNRMLSLSGALYDAEEMLTEEECLQEERLHDARSVIAALKAASFTLDKYGERLDTSVKNSLRSSLVSELGRLERVIDGRRKEASQPFRLDVALGPVLTAERENGLVITNKLGSVKAVGRPLELATVVQNLLVNARRYAPGSTVRVSATSSNGLVQILVEDRGPGVDPTHHELVFQRGYRCNSTNVEGSGLGLYLARRLMREQGGEIVLRERVGGGASFVLSMRSASSVEQAQGSVQIGQTADGEKGRLTDEGDRAGLARLPRQRDHHTRSGNAVGVIGDDQIDQLTRRRARRNLQAT